MIDLHITTIAQNLQITESSVGATIKLLDSDCTIPFVARYRKEATGGLDEVAIAAIRDRLSQLRELSKRRAAILKSLEERNLLTDELTKNINAASSLSILEDIYLPHRPKRRTRATIAREKGLEPLAELLFEQDDFDVDEIAEEFIDPKKQVASTDDALAGARDIIAEWINEDADIRAKMRDLFARTATYRSKLIAGKEIEGAKYSDYFEWEEPVKSAPSHRILAMRRGEAESILSMKIAPDENDAQKLIEKTFVIADNSASRQVAMAASECYKRLLRPAMETEIRVESKNLADHEAIRVFAANLRELLMTAPLGRKNVLAVDPGFRTGCKVVCLDKQGKLLHNTTIFPHGSDRQQEEAASEIRGLVNRFKSNIIAVGNGTAGRETVRFLKSIDLPEHATIEVVNESGASVYSASEVAREEFPDHDITVRGAVSIGRRLMDPLAELVKIDPKAIGVGQYQHDVDQTSLRSGLDDTVTSCVNAVGVEVNTASRQLLTYVSGLGPSLADNIIRYRDENGPFRSRASLKKVPRLGPKAFEQAGGFLRIFDAHNPLDRSAVHPESYHIVKKMVDELGCTVEQLMDDDNLRQKIHLEDYVSDTVGIPTLVDIMDELARPGRDPRQSYASFSFDESVNSIDDVKVGMALPGIVTNVTAFGAFVDIGVHQDGLVHISEMADRFVKDPNEVVKVQQQVTVKVLEVDVERRRISLSLRTDRPS